MTSPNAPSTDPDRLDLATLVARAQAHLEAGRPNEALPYIRAAVRRAPLRRDLRGLLVHAIEAGGQAVDSDLEDAGLEDWQKQYAAPKPPEVVAHPLRHTFGRSRPHAVSAKAVFITVTLVIAGVAGLMYGWSTLRDAGPATGLAPIEGATLDESAVGEEGPDETPVPGDSGDPDSRLVHEAEEYEQGGRLDLAIGKAKALADESRRRPLLARLYTKQAAQFTKANRLQSARTAYENAMEQGGETVELLRGLGSALYELGRIRQPTDREAAMEYYGWAEERLKQALALAPNDAKTLLLLGRLEIARGDDAAAAEHLRAAARIDGASPEAEKAREIMTQRSLRF